MNKKMIIAGKLELRKATLVQEESKALELEERTQALLNGIDSAKTQDELQTIDKQLEELTVETEQVTQKRQALQTEIDTLEAELKQLNSKKPKLEGESGNMPHEVEHRQAVNAYVKSKGYQREGLKSTDAGVLIRPEVLAPKETPRQVLALEDLVSSVKVTHASGKYPIITKSGQKMATVEELAKNPELAKPKITEVTYEVDTYRGYIPIAQEAIDDADYDLTGLIAAEIRDQELNVKNAKIAEVLKSATAKAAQGLDGLKDIINKEISPVYPVTLIVTQSMFAALDKVKDKNGRYMLQQDVTSPTGYKFAGKTIYTLPDDVLGSGAGEMKAFIGDPKAFVTLFDRVQMSVQWRDNEIYGQLLAGYVRFGVKKTDEKAGVYVTYTDAV